MKPGARVLAVAAAGGVAGLLVWSLFAGGATGRDLDKRVVAVGTTLRCPVCQNLSVADSPSELARDMRGTIRTKLRGGETPSEIRAFFVARYGEWILLSPRADGVGILPWAAPLAAVLVGASAIALATRRWRRRGRAPEITEEQRARLREILSSVEDDDEVLLP